MSRIEEKLTIALSHLTEDALEETLEALDQEYSGLARAELDALL